MSETTGISWCDATFNGWWGCQETSPACANCYAKRIADRFAKGRTLWGVGSDRLTFGEEHWRAPLRWAKTLPAKLGRRPRVFALSMGDWLDLDAPIAEFVRLLNLIRVTPESDYLLLTKRIGNWRSRLQAAVAWIKEHWSAQEASELAEWIVAWCAGCPPANVWLGVTVVNQAEANRDLPKLLATPAFVRFISYEPALGPIDATAVERSDGWTIDALRGSYLQERMDKVGHQPALEERREGPRLHWVIVGAESGPHARPIHVEWVRSIVEQCKAAGVAVHVKQLGRIVHTSGTRRPGQHWPDNGVEWDTQQGYFARRLAHPTGGDPAEWPADLRVQQFPDV